MGVDSRGNIKNALRRSHGRYFDDLADSQGVFPAFSGLSAVTLTADTTLALATHSVQVGAYVNIATDAKTLTLPAVTVGSSYIIVNSASDAGALLTISPNSSDKFLVDIAGAAGTDDKDIINTKATQNKYDFVHLIGLAAAGWHIADIRGTWVDQS
tara:strand:+ start:309 stop:776 length:468 start_codon:yes stop_codon:yes gene_type:complete